MFDTDLTNTGQKINAFIDVDSVPYILGDYFNGKQYLNLEPTEVIDSVTIDQSVPNRSLIEISINQVNKDSQGNLMPMGNIEKKGNLEQMVSDYREAISSNYFGVIRKGLIVRLNYRIETESGQIVKSVSEDFKIYDAGLYNYVGDKNVADPALIVNYCDSIVSSINSYTHGTQGLILRINSVKLFYEVISPGKFCYPQYTKKFYPYGKPRHDHGLNRYEEAIKSRNNYYRFGNNNRDIFVNMTDVDSERRRVGMISCGTFYINKLFPVHPAQRIIFKLSVWKNDITIVPNTTQIANILGIYAFDTFDNAEHHFVQSVVEDLQERDCRDRKRDELIENLYHQIYELKREKGPSPKCHKHDGIVTARYSIPQFPIDTKEPCASHFKHVPCPPPPPPPVEECDCGCHSHMVCDPEPDDLFIDDIQRIVDEYMH